MSKNKFKNAFDNALDKSQIIQNFEPIIVTENAKNEEDIRTNVQTSVNTNVQNGDKDILDLIFEDKTKVKSIQPANPVISNNSKPKLSNQLNKKTSLKNQGWLPITILLPPDAKRKLQIKSINENRDMSEILAEAIENI